MYIIPRRKYTQRIQKCSITQNTIHNSAPNINNNIHDTVPLDNSSNIVQISQHWLT